MMFDPEKYLADLILHCRLAFGERLLYMGLQGSYLRGEAREDSDIDVMVMTEMKNFAEFMGAAFPWIAMGAAAGGVFREERRQQEG